MSDTASDLDDTVPIPSDGHFFRAEKGLTDSISSIRLPTYQPHGLSQTNEPINLTDCHMAVVKTIEKARLIGFEIARGKLPFFKQHFEITLAGQHRELDSILASLTIQIDRRLKDINDIKNLSISLQQILKTILAADKDFKRDTGNGIRMKYSLDYKGKRY